MGKRIQNNNIQEILRTTTRKLVRKKSYLRILEHEEVVARRRWQQLRKREEGIFLTERIRFCWVMKESGKFGILKSV